jgi:hypothetical protein
VHLIREIIKRISNRLILINDIIQLLDNNADFNQVAEIIRTLVIRGAPTIGEFGEFLLTLAWLPPISGIYSKIISS